MMEKPVRRQFPLSNLADVSCLSNVPLLRTGVTAFDGVIAYVFISSDALEQS